MTLTLVGSLVFPRHCERSEAIHGAASRKTGLLRCARNEVSGFRAAMLPLAIDRGVSYMIVQEAEISQPLFAGSEQQG
jgi:hypothetical protein